MAASVIGIDTGGTFVDIVHCGPDGALTFRKELADPADLAASVIRGLTALAASQGSELQTLLAGSAMIAHGTTLATNAVLTRTGAATALLTTEGLRDALAFRRGLKEEVFNLRFEAPPPLVPRRLRLAVTERIGADGRVLTPLEAGPAIATLAELVRTGRLRSVAIALMHAWINPAHERALHRQVRVALPDLDVVASHEVMQQVGFYDRLSTTVMTAFAMPLLRGYLTALEERLSVAGFRGELFVISSAGGLMTADDAAREAARTVLSGPAAAPVIGARLAARAGARDAIVVDMGGTSFDVSLVADGVPAIASGGSIGGLRIAFPITDVHTIALGGGSIASVDASGMLRLGPESAGATPGPACFARGGDAATITDADLHLGLIDPELFRRSGLAVDPAAAERALAALALGLHVRDATEAATGIRRLAAARMADAIQRSALAAGIDYRHAPIIVGGGAGPVHASAIGLETGAATVIIPAGAATLCAIGALHLEPHYSGQISLSRKLEASLVAAIFGAMDELDKRLASTVRRPAAGLGVSFSAELRYIGQEQTLSVALTRASIEAEGAGGLRAAFERVHFARCGHVLEGEDVEVDTIRAVATWPLARPVPRLAEAQSGGHSAGTRRAYDVAAGGFRDFAVIDWHRLAPGAAIRAPALIEMVGTTAVVTEPYVATVDPERNVILRRSG